MDFKRSHCWSGKNGEKSVQLVRGASFRGDFLQNPYFKKSFIMIINDFLRNPHFNEISIQEFPQQRATQ